MEVRIDHIQANSHVDGPGKRTVLFMQGCPIHCPGCQNRHLWDLNGGKVDDTLDLSITLANLAIKTGNVTISGGEPFAQVKALAEIVSYLKFYEVRNIIVYTGYTWEQLVSGIAGNWFDVMDALQYIDVIVDGPYRREVDDNLITYRGSRNQRPINVQESLRQRREDGVKAKPVLLNWDNPEICITTDGEAILPIGLAQKFEDLGKVEKTRMCGQTR